MKKIRPIRSARTGPGALAWVQPLPEWDNLPVSGQRVSQTYTLCNVSDKPIHVRSITLKPGQDSRLSLSGDALEREAPLLPQETCSIQVEVNPKSVGQVKQTLLVVYGEANHELKAKISFFVTEHLTQDGEKNKQRSYLVDETEEMENARRDLEQDGHRKYARVHARERRLRQEGPEQGLQQSIAQNPWLNSQRFDGIDPNLNPEPAVNDTAQEEFDAARNEQELEKQLRLGIQPKFKAPPPRPQGGG